MTQEEKQLLLIDLCARLPYGIKCKDFVYDNEGNKIERIDTIECIIPQEGKYKYTETDVYHNISRIKPYLRPMLSMTEEEFEDLKSYSGLTYNQLDLASYQNGTYKCLDFYLNEIPSDVVILVFDWLNKNHFDYRGLIERGLALEALEGMYQ